VISETLFVLDRDADLKRRPDVAFVSRTRWPGRPQQTEAWDVIPDLAVEVVSPTNTADEVLEKIDEYFRFGVRLVWVIYCEPLQVYVYRSAKDVRVLRPGDDLEGGDVLPGFRLPIDTLAEDVGQEAK
jgi:Uma2 family endonuclease